MREKLIRFIVRYEYARGQFDLRAANVFGGKADSKAAELFKELATTEINHGERFSKLINLRISRSRFFTQPQWTLRHDQFKRELPIAGLSLQKWWTRFLFNGKSVKDFDEQDLIPICAAAEFLETNIYRLLSVIGGEFGSLCRAIALEENNAHKRLLDLSRERNLQTRLVYWHLKSLIALFILIITFNANFPRREKPKNTEFRQ